MKSAVFGVLFLMGVLAQAEQGPAYVVTPKSVEERLAELEANQHLRYLSFSGFLINTYDHISVSESYPDSLDHSDLQYLRLRFSLNADAEISPQVRVYTRLTTTKFVNNWRTQGGSPSYIQDIEGIYSNSGSWIFLEKAYVDLSCPESVWTLSVGRLPTVNGSPEHMWDLLPRQGTYPLLTFDAPLGGAALTYRADRLLPQDHELAVRLLYTPFVDVFWGGNLKYLKPPQDDTNGNTPVGNETDTLINMGSVQLDYSIQNPQGAEQAGFILQYYKSGRLPFSSGAGTSDLNVQVDGVTGLLDVIGIAQTGWDVSVSHSYTNAISDGLLAPGLGFGTDQEHGSNYGSLTLLSARYRWSSWAAGAEWLSSSDAPFYFSAAPENLTRFYSTPGHSGHLYLTKKWLSLVTIRAGYRQQNYSSLPLGFGPVQSTDRILKTYYLSLRTDF
ncbi:DUF3373 family protein [Bdellovibrio bacteriovorus]|uniref:DUF3373 family protein n=1 Tax=Bdellovibrio bacteriovorus TaxID=959 RepID=UPI003CFE111A